MYNNQYDGGCRRGAVYKLWLEQLYISTASVHMYTENILEYTCWYERSACAALGCLDQQRWPFLSNFSSCCPPPPIPNQTPEGVVIRFQIFTWAKIGGFQ